MYDEDVDIGLLIGCNCFKVIVLIEFICGKGEEFYVVWILLGWSIVGLVVILDIFRDGYVLDFICYCILIREVIFGVSDSVN